MSVTPQYPTLHDEIARQILQLRDRVYRLLLRVYGGPLLLVRSGHRPSVG